MGDGTPNATRGCVAPVGRLFDVRPGEARRDLAGFPALLLLVIAAHTILETARDALLLTGPGPRALGLVYIAIAIGTIPGAALAARAGERYGQRRALGGSLAIAVVGPALLFVAPSSHAAAMATYVLSGILSSILVPQFWTLLGNALTVSQGRRLFGLISSGGIVGAVLGSAAASATLWFLPVKALLLASSLVFLAAGAVLALVRVTERTDASAPRKAPPFAAVRALREQPFLTRVATIVFLSTATFLTLDYLFKSAVARALPPADVGPFVAHYYLALNCVSLAMQLLVTGAVVRYLGVLPALVLTPLLLVGGAAIAFAGGGALAGVLLVKGIDGSLRYSIHRVTGELIVLPVPSLARQRAKPFIDGALGRGAQTITAAALLALGGTALAAPRPLAAAVALLGGAWLVVAATTRRPYLRLLRAAVTAGSLETSETRGPIDLAAAEMLVQRLASDDPLEVDGAIATLARRGRAGFVPALVLLHPDERVLLQALEVFGASSRADWFSLARRLLDDPRETVRMAAARALARHEQLDPSQLANHVGRRTRGYAAVRMALRDPSTAVEQSAAIVSLLDPRNDGATTSALGMLAAIADSPPDPRLLPLLRRLAGGARGSREGRELAAAAAARQEDRLLVPQLVAMVAEREGREAVRAALVTFGDVALDEVNRNLRDPDRPRRLRMHLAKTLARFATKRAAECLLETIERERDGLVRDKAIGALRLVVTEHRITVDRRRVEGACLTDVERHFRHLAAREALAAAEHEALPGRPGEWGLVLELLEEKATHALERAFHLLQIAYPRQGVHHALLARRSEDRYTRANAAELVDTLLRRRNQQRLRVLFRIASDDLTAAERVARARSAGLELPATRDEALRAIAQEDDAMLSALTRRFATVPREAPGPARGVAFARAGEG